MKRLPGDAQLNVLAAINAAVVLCAIALTGGGFIDPYNLQSMAGQVPELGLLAIGVMLAMIAGNGGIDLSGIALANLAGVCAGVLLPHWVDAGQTPLLFTLALVGVALAVGLLGGLLNGLLIACAGLTPTLCTLGTHLVFARLAAGLAVGVRRAGGGAGGRRGGALRPHRAAGLHRQRTGAGPAAVLHAVRRHRAGHRRMAAPQPLPYPTVPDGHQPQGGALRRRAAAAHAAVGVHAVRPAGLGVRHRDRGAQFQREVGLRQFLCADRHPDRGDGRRAARGWPRPDAVPAAVGHGVAVPVEHLQLPGGVELLSRLRMGADALAVRRIVPLRRALAAAAAPASCRCRAVPSCGAVQFRGACASKAGGNRTMIRHTACTLAAVACIAGAAWAQDKQSIVTVVKVIGENWFTRMGAGVKEFGQTNAGVATSMAGPARGDSAQQLRVIEDLVAKKPSAITVVPMDPGMLEGVLKRAMERGIVIVTHEADTARNTQADIEAFDNAAFGARLNDRLAKCMGESGKWTTFVGSLGSLTHMQWAGGGAGHAARYPKMTLVDAHNESFNKAYEKAKEILRKHPDIEGFQGGSAIDVIGIGRAVEEAGLQHKTCVFGLGLPQDSGKYLETGAIDG